MQAQGSEPSSPAALDKAAFTTALQLIALRIPAQRCSALQKLLQGFVLHVPKVRPIIPDPADEGVTAGGPPKSRLLLLSEAVKCVGLLDIPDNLREQVLAEGATPIRHEQQLGYEHLSAEQVLRRLLPQGMEVPSAFEQVGHVAHVNLRDEQRPFKALIGEVLLDKNSPRIRTIVNKVESISNEYRVFPMEVLAGVDDLVTQVRENGAVFKLDFREVYWNSRLEREHRRIVHLIRPDEVVCDMMAGIGPFAVPAALRGCNVYANDLNPESVRWLRANVAHNKVGPRVDVYNLCAREFLRALVQPPPAGDEASAAAGSAADAPSRPDGSLRFGYFSHCLMNLPASALEFLDVFVGAFDRARWQAPLPRVHCHCFSKAEDPAADVIAQAEAIMGCRLPEASATVVRDVSPHKLMMCLSFVVPDDIAWAPVASADGEGTEAKRQRLEE